MNGRTFKLLTFLMSQTRSHLRNLLQTSESKISKNQGFQTFSGVSDMNNPTFSGESRNNNLKSDNHCFKVDDHLWVCYGKGQASVINLKVTDRVRYVGSKLKRLADGKLLVVNLSSG